jgi:hypothetical protein
MQSDDLVEPVFGMYRPAAQPVQATVPGKAAYWPAPHQTHEVDESAPVGVEYLPTAQLTHVVDMVWVSCDE